MLALSAHDRIWFTARVSFVSTLRVSFCWYPHGELGEFVVRHTYYSAVHSKNRRVHWLVDGILRCDLPGGRDRVVSHGVLNAILTTNKYWSFHCSLLSSGKADHSAIVHQNESVISLDEHALWWSSGSYIIARCHSIVTYYITPTRSWTSP